MKLTDDEKELINIGLRLYQHDKMTKDEETKSTGIFDPLRICKAKAKKNLAYAQKALEIAEEVSLGNPLDLSRKDLYKFCYNSLEKITKYLKKSEFSQYNVAPNNEFRSWVLDEGVDQKFVYGHEEEIEEDLKVKYLPLPIEEFGDLEDYEEAKKEYIEPILKAFGKLKILVNIPRSLKEQSMNYIANHHDKYKHEFKNLPIEIVERLKEKIDVVKERFKLEKIKEKSPERYAKKAEEFEKVLEKRMSSVGLI